MKRPSAVTAAVLAAVDEGLVGLLEDPTQSQADAPLHRLTTLRVGGAAARLVQLRSSAEAAKVLTLLASLEVPWAPLGLGSNVIIPDEGYPGVILRMVGSLQGVSIDGERAIIGAGTTNAQAVRVLHASGLIGAECVALVPGTLGGAVAMNAGTRHGELSSVLDAAEVALPNGELVWLDASELSMSYRTTKLPEGALVTRVALRLKAGDVDEARERVRAEKQYRSATQPFKLATSGSIFRNPPGDYAGRLIEANGLKGARCGGAVISDLHANWVVNEGGATALDILTLLARARVVVARATGVWLEPEVRLLSPYEGVLAALAPLESGFTEEVVG